MTAKGYTTVATVSALLGVTLTTDQEVQCAQLLEGVENTIDRVTSRAWLTGAITDELHRPDGRYLYLKNSPVTSIQAITGHTLGSTTVKTMTANRDYYAVDLTRGLLYLYSGAYYDYLLVDYTPAATLPAEIGYAATRIAAHRLGYTLGGSLASGAGSGASTSVRSLSIGGEVSVTYGGGGSSSSSSVARQAAEHDVPEDVMGVLLGYRGVVFA